MWHSSINVFQTKTIFAAFERVLSISKKINLNHKTPQLFRYSALQLSCFTIAHKPIQVHFYVAQFKRVWCLKTMSTAGYRHVSNPIVCMQNDCCVQLQSHQVSKCFSEEKTISIPVEVVQMTITINAPQIQDWSTYGIKILKQQYKRQFVWRLPQHLDSVANILSILAI